MNLTVYIDFKSSGSYLALEPTLALAERHGATIDWRPFSTAERDTPSTGADQSVIESHRTVREASRRATDQKYAQLRGMTLTFPESETETDLALGVLSEISGDPLPFIKAAFAAYWEDHADLNDPGVVADLINSSDAAHSRDFAGTHAAFEAAQAQAEEAGVVEAPATIVEGQIFVGRQHLPWIEEILNSEG